MKKVLHVEKKQVRPSFDKNSVVPHDGVFALQEGTVIHKRLTPNVRGSEGSLIRSNNCKKYDCGKK